MNSPQTAILVVLGSVLSIFFTYGICKWVLWMDSLFPEWVKRNGFRVIKMTMVFELWGPAGWQSHGIYFTVEDAAGNKRSGWITFAWFSGKEIILWDRKPVGT
jgi:hypothetical protein